MMSNRTEVEELVIQQIRDRRDAGRAKYGTTMERTDLSIMDWLQHAQEEALDLSIYLERIKQDVQVLADAAYAAADLIAAHCTGTKTKSNTWHTLWSEMESRVGEALLVLRGAHDDLSPGTHNDHPPAHSVPEEIAQLRRDVEWLRLRIGPLEGDS